MFEAKTVLVLGAGASVEVGLPVGSQLLDDICKLIDIKFDFSSQKSGDRTIFDALKIVVNEDREVVKTNEHLHCAWQILKSAEQGLSIDNIVDALEDERIELIAKLGIVRAIQMAEEKSQCFSKPLDHNKELELSHFKSSWYDSLTKAICEKRRVSDISKVFENLSIISFNYDRCIERYLPFSIANYYGVSSQTILDLMPRLKIVRPYGIAGLLPWMPNPISKYNSDHRIHAAQLANSAEMIRTFTQGVADETVSAEIRSVISDAERIIFLGFAFHPQNMEILTAKVDQSTQVLATAHSASENDRRVIQDSILNTFGYRGDRPSSIFIAPETCSELFRSYWRTITAPPLAKSIRYHLSKEAIG